ncbi:MAG: nitrogen regulation protein NR(I) [Gammaproteobacteria bacterium]|nr:MAG: nitrogen regulation protein NR(I) [Gammaproteobacteria bacterium]
MGKKPTVWVVDDDESIRWVLEQALKEEGYTVSAYAEATGLPQLLKKGKPDVLITDIRMPGLSGLDLLARIQQHCPELPVIVMTAYSDLDSAVSAYSSGAFEYLPKPFDIDEALSLVERALAQKAKNQETIESGEQVSGHTMIGEAPAMQEVFRAIGRLSRASLNVLIIGESGTGKELVARALHQHSTRADKPFVAINTAAIPADLLESELFGHEKGAFTGAVTQRAGRFEQANGGTLFLDEIGEMPSELQTRLLRVLAEGSFYRVGGRNQVSVDVRIVAATNRDLEQRVAQGKFREDLYHRLNVVRIDVPPLRERREDIPALANFFLQQAARELNLEDKKLAPETLQAMQSLHWSGNVRQLQNICNWLMVMAPGQVIGVKDLPPELREEQGGAEQDGGWLESVRAEASRRLADGKNNVMNDMAAGLEQTLIETALAATRGRKQDAANRLGLGRNTLTRKLKQYGMNERVDGE